MRRALLALFAVAACGVQRGPAGETLDIRADMDALKKELAGLRQKAEAIKPPVASRAEGLIDNKYGPNATVSAKQGKLTLGALWQVWFYSIQNDNHNWLDADALGGGRFGSNETTDNISVYASCKVRIIDYTGI